MAIIKEADIQQSTREIRMWTVDFTDDLPTGVTVASGTSFHTPPSGTIGTATLGTTTTTITATLGPLATTGIHYLDVQAVFSNSEKSEVRIVIPVNYPTATARASMADLVLVLRGLTSAGANDYSVGGNPYWTDAQLQDVLDRHSTQIRHEALHAIPQTGVGTIAWFDYQSSKRFLESTNGGTSRFVVQDETGGTLGTAAWTADYPRGLITFGTDTGGLTRYLNGYSYDMNAAAADVWSQKASHYVTAYDFSTDNHNLKRSQIIDNCLKMSREYAAGAAVFTVSMERSDTDVSYG